jgi:hypothetical protein
LSPYGLSDKYTQTDHQKKHFGFHTILLLLNCFFVPL